MSGGGPTPAALPPALPAPPERALVAQRDEFSGDARTRLAYGLPARPAADVLLRLPPLPLLQTPGMVVTESGQP